MTNCVRSFALAAVLALSACAQLPQAEQTLPGPAIVAAEPAPVVAMPPAPAPQPEQVTVAAIAPETHGDLFDRMRAGFGLADSDRRAIEQQLDWYARNPEYLERTFGRAELYLHHIISEVEARRMPLEIALLPVVESAFEPYAYSRARAAGLWQFIPGTGSRFGLRQNWWYDGRRDVIEATRAALDYLQFMHDEFNGDWLLAIAGYNCGEACVARAIRNNQAAGLAIDFWSLKLPAETRAYVPKLLAMKRLVAEPEIYGIGFSPIANEPYFTRVETLGQIDLNLAAELAGVTYEELFELNPAFHRWATDPAGPHYLLLPTDAATLFRENLAQLTPEERLRAKRYTVQKGDTVTSVARRFDTQQLVVRDLNGLQGTTLTAGTELLVPAGMAKLPPKVLRAAALADGRTGVRRATRRPVVHVVRRGDSLWAIARRHRMDAGTLASLNNMQLSDTLRAGQRLVLRPQGAGSTAAADGAKSRKLTYTVRRGDTLSRIARLYQVTVAQLTSWNGISVHAPLRPGQRLTIRLRRGG